MKISDQVLEGNKRTAWWLMRLFIISSLAILIGTNTAQNMDLLKNETDGRKEWSGLKIYTDAATGCEYLGTADGGMTPRLYPSGRHMC